MSMKQIWYGVAPTASLTAVLGLLTTAQLKPARDRIVDMIFDVTGFPSTMRARRVRISEVDCEEEEEKRARRRDARGGECECDGGEPTG